MSAIAPAKPKTAPRTAPSKPAPQQGDRHAHIDFNCITDEQFQIADDHAVSRRELRGTQFTLLADES